MVRKLSPAIICEMYQDLTGDVVANTNSISKEVRKRLKLMLETQDASIIFDLRVNGDFHGTKFDLFWAEMESYFNSVSIIILLNFKI